MGSFFLALIVAVIAYIVFLKLVLVGAFWAFIIGVVVFGLIFGGGYYWGVVRHR